MEKEVYRSTGITGEEGLSCGCTGVAARGRKLCPYAKALKSRLDDLLDDEKLTRKLYGSASPERHRVMGERLKAQEAFYGHLRGNPRRSRLRSGEDVA